MSTSALELNFGKAGDGVACGECRAALNARIEEICRQWSEVKVCVPQVTVVRVQC